VLPVFGVTKTGMFSEIFSPQVRDRDYAVMHGVGGGKAACKTV
jgi:hypothetical protein